MATKNIGFQSFYQSQLTSSITDTDLTIPLDTLPTPSEGYLVIESTVSAKREIIYYTSKTATAVVVPSGTGNGRGFDGTTAVSHTQGATVIMAPIGAMFGNQAIKDMLGITADPTGSWNLLAGGAPTVSSVTANGNRSYTINFASDYSTTLSPGMRIKTTRTVAAPTQCTSLNGTSQYYNKTSPSGMTFTDDFVVSAWIKLSSYPTNRAAIVQRTDGTSANGWVLDVNSSGQIRLLGYSGGIANVSYVSSYQSVPLNKWVHVAAQLDMSGFSTTPTGTISYVMIDGVDVPASVTRAGTNPTSLVNTGDLQIGKTYTTEYFPGKIAQVAIYSAKVTQANIRATISQGLSGSETSLISAYSFNNSINDLNTSTANNLTAQGSAVATNADSPFGCQADGSISSTLDYSIITKIATTAVTVQVPEGCTIPTTGGVAGVSYATVKIPYGFPAQRGKWQILSIIRVDTNNGASTADQYYNVAGFVINTPVGAHNIRAYITGQATTSAGAARGLGVALATSAGNFTDLAKAVGSYVGGTGDSRGTVLLEVSVENTVATPIYVNIASLTSAATALYIIGSADTKVIAENAYL